VIEMASSLQCAEFAGHIGGLELAQLATEIAREYNQAWLAVERNNHGHGVLALMETVCHYPRLYRQGDTPGLLVTLGNKPALIGLLNAEIIEQPDHFMSRRLLAECRSFVRHPDGSMGARAGTHDDLVMATSIGLWTRGEILTGSGSRR
jgi:hypothetical protein